MNHAFVQCYLGYLGSLFLIYMMTDSIVGKPWEMFFGSVTQKFISIQSTNFL